GGCDGGSTGGGPASGCAAASATSGPGPRLKQSTASASFRSWGPSVISVRGPGWSAHAARRPRPGGTGKVVCTAVFVVLIAAGVAGRRSEHDQYLPISTVRS